MYNGFRNLMKCYDEKGYSGREFGGRGEGAIDGGEVFLADGVENELMYSFVCIAELWDSR